MLSLVNGTISKNTVLRNSWLRVSVCLRESTTTGFGGTARQREAGRD